MRYIKNSLGEIKYMVKQSGPITEVFDRTGTLLGFIKEGNTYSANGSLVAQGEDISALTVG